jgi:hypothetical protein
VAIENAGAVACLPPVASVEQHLCLCLCFRIVLSIFIFINFIFSKKQETWRKRKKLT